jgi:uncharacterized membrane protein YeiB
LQTWVVLLLAIIIWPLLTWLATIWLKRYKQGPLEWLVNVITKERKDLSSAT